MTVLRAGLWLLAAVETGVGVVATFLPGVFYEKVPWVALTPPYSEHLMRDYGAMNLAVAVVLVVAAVTLAPLLVRTALAAMVVFAVPHLVFHATHLDRFDPAAATTEMVALGVGALLPAALLVVSLRHTGRR